MTVKGAVELSKNPGRDVKKIEVNLEEALDLAGAGKYQFFHCALMLATLTSAILEMIGIAFILPAATCDLDLPENLRGIITSVPNIGAILTAAAWGRAADTFGRKIALVVSCAGAGVIGVIAAFMPSLLAYALVKFVGSLFLACPSSLAFAYAGEMMPRKRRDIAILVINGLLMVMTVFTPVLAWAILPNVNTSFRPWRLLSAVYATPLVLTSLLMIIAKESPKFLVAKGRNQEAIEILRHIYSKNTGQPPENYCVESIKSYSEESSVGSEDGSDVDLTSQARNQSAWALLQPPHLKWFALTGFLMFGVFSSLNGLFLFAPDTINKVFKESSEEAGTICILMDQSENMTTEGVCEDTISTDTFIITVATALAYGVVVLGASVCPVSKKTLLVAMYSVVGGACLLCGLLTNRVVAGLAMSALQLTSLGIGPLTAYAVHLYPTSLRGLAVGALLMFGRLGSVVGANAAGFFLSVACGATFYGFAVLLFLCAALSFLLPRDRTSSSSRSEQVDSDGRLADL